ncbi:MAG: DUF21 domain-containing protein [Kiritimatiellae bacterium]|nr:DUF21 domain-containing protein [Kiritimatiellia bacterium]
MNDFAQFFIVILGIIGSAFYSGLETGIVAINPLRLRHMVRKKVLHAKILETFALHPDHLLGTTLVGNNLCNVIASVVAISLGTQWMGTAGSSIAYVVLTIVMLVFGEYLPKAWFQSLPAERTLPFAKALKFNTVLFYPMSRAALFLSRCFIPVPPPKERIKKPFITLDELKHLAHESKKTGTLSSKKHRMINSVLELTQKTCEKIMIPRDRMVFVDTETSTFDLLELARKKQTSRLPVYDLEAKRFIGIVHIHDVVIDKKHGNKETEDYMRPPQYISSETPADEILPRMRISHNPMALVHNRHSQVIGLVTIEDILEEIIGEL